MLVQNLNSFNLIWNFSHSRFRIAQRYTLWVLNKLAHLGQMPRCQFLVSEARLNPLVITPRLGRVIIVFLSLTTSY